MLKMRLSRGGERRRIVSATLGSFIAPWTDVATKFEFNVSNVCVCRHSTGTNGRPSQQRRLSECFLFVVLAWDTTLQHCVYEGMRKRKKERVWTDDIELRTAGT